MRLWHSVVITFSSLALLPACTANQDDCAKNPNLPCYSAGGAGGAGGGGAGGGGGGASCDPAKCPVPPGDCQQAVCLNSQCSTDQKVDGSACGVNGASRCKGGACGCADVSECSPADCNDLACNDGKCEYTPNGASTCGPGGAGTCAPDGTCGLCDDGVKNGGESGVDCGAGTPGCGACAGQVCTTGVDCKGGFCADGVCCDTACDGRCAACTQALTGLPDGTCGPLGLGATDPDSRACVSLGGCGAVPGFCLCEDGVKNGNETDVDCGGPCGTTCTTGAACGGDGDCDFDQVCVDGFCCNDSCEGDCEACNLPGLPGLCSPVVGDDAPMCASAEQCDAKRTCSGANGQMCSGDGDCASGKCMGSPKKCVACGAGVACPGGKPCVGGVCVAKDLDKGVDCVGAAQCKSGFCVDGVCCENACAGKCMSCHINYTAQSIGTCAPMVSGYDPQSECEGPGNEAACSGQPPDGNGDSACGQN